MGNSLESNPNGPAYSNNTNNRRVAKWYWKEDNMWHLYDDQTTKMLEDAFSNRQTSLLLEHGFFTNVSAISLSVPDVSNLQISEPHWSHYRLHKLHSDQQLHPQISGHQERRYSAKARHAPSSDSCRLQNGKDRSSSVRFVIYWRHFGAYDGRKAAV